MHCNGGQNCNDIDATLEIRLDFLEYKCLFLVLELQCKQCNILNTINIHCIAANRRISFANNQKRHFLVSMGTDCCLDNRMVISKRVN